MSSLPPRISGALSAQYRLEHEIGAGGMATVYLADDLRHDRRVALKVLRPELAAVIGAERFLAEIKLTANLQHPHILPLFDSGEADGFLYYVMPFVEGESLRERLRREKQLPVEDAVRIAREVADALDYAHRHGVIHRDIKPENILLHDGRALVADFGIALAASKAGGTRMTETGMSLGTPHYMSPEQAMGEREITARSDVYALGAVLYEMLSGDPPFTGSTAQAVVARVVTESPRPLLPQRHTIPPHVEAAVLKALEKLPADRFASAAQFAEALTRPGGTVATERVTVTSPAALAGQPRRRLSSAALISLALIGAAALGFMAAQLRRPAASPERRPVRFLFTGSDSAAVVDVPPWPAAISPDGATLVYAVADQPGTTTLYARRSDQLAGHPIPGTTNGGQPLFSPDGEWVAFEADGKEMKVRLDGSAPVAIADGGSYNGADWTTTGELVVGSTNTTHGLSHVSVAGGELERFTVPDSAKGETDHLWPIALPDGRNIVFVLWYGTLASSKLAMTSLADGKITPLNLKGIRPLAILEGALVYVQADGAVMAVGLDAAHKRIVGRPVPVLDPVPVGAANNGNSAVFVSRGGALVSAQGTHRAQLMWIGRDGVSRPIGAGVRDFALPRLAPDGRRLAVLVSSRAGSDIWIYEMATGTLSRLTSAGSVTSLAWTRDGSRIVYSAAGTGSRAAIWSQSVGVAAAPEMLAEIPNLAPDASVAPDGRTLLVPSLLENGWHLLRVPVDSPRTLQPYGTAKGNELAPRFAPDGRWAAVVSDESGTSEVYIRSFPQPTLKLQASVAGGTAPVWSSDGGRLYYYIGDAIVEARLGTAPDLRVISRDTAFSHIQDGASRYTQANFDVTSDGSRMVMPVSESHSYGLIVVPNWLPEFRQRMAASKQ
jgi:eukaryotic-like serine/threonine-protein kinase